MANNRWTREELILAFNLYCKIPFGKIHNRNPDIIKLAALLERTPSAVSWKLANFARLDPSLKERNISGATHGSKLDIEIWDEFNHDWDRLSFESENLLAEKEDRTIEDVSEIDTSDLSKIGEEREAVVKIRVNQSFFRKSVLSAYNHRCCITGIQIPEILNASHIIPWSKDETNRVNPRNGLCLNAFHDRAFDRGLLTVTPDFKIKISNSIKSIPTDKTMEEYFIRYDGAEIELPKKFVPDAEFLDYHNKNIFKG